MRRARVSLSLRALAWLTVATYGAGLHADTSGSTVNRQLVLAKSARGFQWQLITAPRPAVGRGQVLMKVHAAALNRTDLELLAPDSIGRPGLVVGSDAAGAVESIGPGVVGLRVGDRVNAMFFRDWIEGSPSEARTAAVRGYSIDGVIADYVAIDASSVALSPKGLNYEQAASLPTSALTAWMALTKDRAPRPSEAVLVQGTGGVSVFAIQFARALGARVLVASSSDAKLERARLLGADAVVNYLRQPNWAAEVRTLTAGLGAHVVIDVGGSASLAQSAEAVAHEGRIALVGGVTGYDGSVPALPLILKAARAQGVYGGSRADFERMRAFIEREKIEPVIDSVFEMREHQQALERLRSGANFGKIVIRLQSEEQR